MFEGPMSMKQAQRFLVDGDEVQFRIRAEKVTDMRDPVGSALHIIVTQQAILLIDVSIVTGNPTEVRMALPRDTHLGPVVGRRQNRIIISGVTYKLSKKGVADVLAADERAHLPPLRPRADAPAPVLSGIRLGPVVQAATTGEEAPLPSCPGCGVGIRPDWDWCHACGFDPDALNPDGSR